MEVVLETPTGLPGQSLNRVAQEHDAALLVLGTHGKSLWREGVLGSFSSAALHKASYPILLLPVRITADRDVRPTVSGAAGNCCATSCSPPISPKLPPRPW